MTISMEEFLKLIKEVVEEEEKYLKYDEPEEDTLDYSTAVAELLKKHNRAKKVLLSKKSGSIDVTNMKRNEILTHIKTKSEFTIGNFIVHVDNGDKEDYVNIHILENQHKTASGFPCNMLVKKDVVRDKRFSSCPWLSYFSSKHGSPRRTAYNVPAEEIINIIKWIKAINKMTAFL